MTPALIKERRLGITLLTYLRAEDSGAPGKHVITSLTTASSWPTQVDGRYDHPDTVSVPYHAAAARSASDRFTWLAHVC